MLEEQYARRHAIVIPYNLLTYPILQFYFSKNKDTRKQVFTIFLDYFSFDFWGIMVMIMIRTIKNNIVTTIKTIRESIATKQI